MTQVARSARKPFVSSSATVCFTARTRMIASPLVASLALSAGLVLAACGSNPDASDGQCGSADPCACVAPAPGQTCKADGIACVCTDVGDSGPADAGAPVEAQAGPDLALFAGRWSPIAGDGQSNCNGGDSALPPNPSAVLTFTPDSASTLTATSSGAPGCSLELVVAGTTASLLRASESCAQPGGSAVSFTVFNLVYMPAGSAAPGTDAGDEAGADGAGASGDAAARDAGPGVTDAASAGGDAAADDASSDDGGSPEDAVATAEDAAPSDDAGESEDAGASAAPPDGGGRSRCGIRRPPTPGRPPPRDRGSTGSSPTRSRSARRRCTTRSSAPTEGATPRPRAHCVAAVHPAGSLQPAVAVHVSQLVMHLPVHVVACVWHVWRQFLPGFPFGQAAVHVASVCAHAVEQLFAFVVQGVAQPASVPAASLPTPASLPGAASLIVCASAPGPESSTLCVPPSGLAPAAPSGSAVAASAPTKVNWPKS